MTWKEISEINWELGRISGLANGAETEADILDAVEAIGAILDKAMKWGPIDQPFSPGDFTPVSVYGAPLPNMDITTTPCVIPNPNITVTCDDKTIDGGKA